MIPPELSKHLQDKFKPQLRGMVKFSERAGIEWLYNDDLNRFIDEVAESAIRWANEEVVHVSSNDHAGRNITHRAWQAPAKDGCVRVG